MLSRTRSKQDEIAARQLHALKQHQSDQSGKLRLSDVKEMFLQMKDYAIRHRWFNLLGRIRF
jgi:hypothetical protein